jgi:hypothetical protein
MPAAHAEGMANQAKATGSHAEGRATVTEGDFAHAEGSSYLNNTFIREATAQGYASHVEGIGGVASGVAAHAGGFQTTAQGNYSHAGGYWTIAEGTATTALGEYTKAIIEAQTVVGKYNAEDNTAMFIVGVGTPGTKANAFTAGNDGTDDYITIGEEKLTESELKSIKDGFGDIDAALDAILAIQEELISGSSPEPVPSEGLAFTAIDGGYEVSGIGECTDTNIVIPSEYEELPVVSIGNMAFSGCTSITSVVIPDGITSIGDDAFYGCSNIEIINIPDSVTSIGMTAFSGINSKAYTEYENAYYLGNDSNPHVVLCRMKDKNATSLTISDNAKFIMNWSCSQSQLTNITIPENVIWYSSDTFYGCSNLTTVVICGRPSMGRFDDCPNITDIYVPWSEGEVYGAPWGATNATIHYNSEV